MQVRVKVDPVPEGLDRNDDSGDELFACQGFKIDRKRPGGRTAELSEELTSELKRIPIRTLITSVLALVIIPVILLVSKNESLGPMLRFPFLGAIVGIIYSAARIARAKQTRNKEISKVVTYGRDGFSFANKDYQARVRKFTTAAVPSGLLS
jgi:hypothetical protein